MFKVWFVCYSDYYKNYGIYIDLISRVSDFYKELKFEPCELGKNINLKYKDLIENLISIEKNEISDYLCINYDNTKFYFV